MDKKELFKKAMDSGLYRELPWLIAAFSVSNEADNEWKKNPYPYRIVSNITGHYCVSEDKQTLLPIEGVVADKPIYAFTELIQITPQDISNCSEPLETTYGNWLANMILLVRPFGKKITYMDGDITTDRIEKILLTRFKDNPKNPQDRKDDEFYVDEYLKYEEGVYFLPGLSQLCVWAATEKTILPPPGVAELKAKLIKENEGKLDDLATIAKIDAELVRHDLEWLKGDPGMNFLGGGKAINVVRKKKFLMHGGEVGLTDNAVKGTLVENALNEGWDINKFPDVIDTLRAGSYDRGAETQLGGVSVKWLLRASSNMDVTSDDCKSSMGVALEVTSTNKKRLIGFTAILDGEQKHIVKEEEANTYLGKKIMLRSPMYCRLDHTDFCKTCLGDNLSINPEGLSLSISAYGSVMLDISLSKMHGKQLTTAKMDFKETIF